MARTGKPISPEERRERSDIELIQNINRSIRFDPAGRKSEVYVMEKLGCDLEISNKILKLIIDPLVEGIRKRTAHDRTELKLRAEARAQAELDGVRSYAVQNEAVATPSGVSVKSYNRDFVRNELEKIVNRLLVSDIL